MPPAASTLARELESLLQRRGAELSRLLQQDAALLPGVAFETQDFKDLAEQDTRATIDAATQALLTQELAQVVAALRRIQSGTYGLCASCGQAIPQARLRAMPSAALCTACQAEREGGGAS